MSTLTYSISTAILWGELVKSAYSTYELDTKNTNPPAAVDLPAGWQVVANLQSDPVAGIFSEIQFIGFLVQSTADAGQYGIVFRGTEGVMDWLADFEARHVEFTDVPNGGRTESGFTEMFRSLKAVKPGDTALQTLDEFLKTLPGDTTITVSGHSLGGAIANLTAIWIAAKHASFPLELYSFAAPMTGDATFAATFNLLVPNSFRIFNKPDIVPTVPFHQLGYDQVNSGYEVNSLDYPNLPRNILGYHAMDTYLYLLQQELQK
ncbi:lipase (class 3) [Tumebacillus sp. BK434]|uniref:lipase family protein n=1 Tax=Tumebacillus sp. BK434 TaxID=2512169 RepID=UPI001044F747|nr:lipase family protein [Tumebacillus sp. BK434]TCP52624.1 lipase (class 3) [Tumebacillus sp. BK434]